MVLAPLNLSECLPRINDIFPRHCQIGLVTFNQVLHLSGPVRQRNHYFKSSWDGLVNSTRWNDIAWEAGRPIIGVAISSQQWISQIDRASLCEQAREVAATEVSGRGIPQQGVAATASEAFPGKEPEHLVAQVGLRQQDRTANCDTQFEDVSSQAGTGIAQQKSSRGAAFGDFDNDGDVDVLVMNMGDTPSLLKNDLSGFQPLDSAAPGRLEIQSECHRRDCPDEAAGAVQTQSVLSQSSYVSQNDFRLHFGLGSAARVDRITVRWPSGTIQEFPERPADGQVLLVEGSETTKRLTMPRS